VNFSSTLKGDRREEEGPVQVVHAGQLSRAAVRRGALSLTGFPLICKQPRMRPTATEEARRGASRSIVPAPLVGGLVAAGRL